MTTAPTNEMLALADELDTKLPVFHGRERDLIVRVITALSNLDAAAPAAGGGWVALGDDTSWLDGRDVVLLARGMEVSARYCPGEWSDDTPVSQREYSGPVWSCFDDQFQFEIVECSGDPKQWSHDGATHWRIPTPPLQAPAHSDAVLVECFDRNKRYMDAFDGKNELHCGPAMLRWALEETDGLLRQLSALTAPAAKAPAVSEAGVGRKLIEAERARQISEEGWSTAHDDTHDDGQLLHAGMCYLSAARSPYEGRPRAPMGWPWTTKWWKPSTPERNFVKAGALLIAERDRLARAGRPHSHIDHKIELTIKWLNELSAAQGGGTEGGEA